LKSNEIHDHDQKCPVCGKTTVEEYGICDICGWENDPVQSWTPTLAGGANRMSLEKAKEAYRKGMPIE
jgi:hypothetical protein